MACSRNLERAGAALTLPFAVVGARLPSECAGLGRSTSSVQPAEIVPSRAPGKPIRSGRNPTERSTQCHVCCSDRLVSSYFPPHGLAGSNGYRPARRPSSRIRGAARELRGMQKPSGSLCGDGLSSAKRGLRSSRRDLSQWDAGHHEAEALDSGLVPIENAHQLALIEYRDAIREIEDFVEVLGDE